MGTVCLPFLTWWSVAVRSLLSPEHFHPSAPHPHPVFLLPTLQPTNFQPLLRQPAISRDGGVGSCSKGGPARCGGQGLPTSQSAAAHESSLVLEQPGRTCRMAEAASWVSPPYPAPGGPAGWWEGPQVLGQRPRAVTPLTKPQFPHRILQGAVRIAGGGRRVGAGDWQGSGWAGQEP